MLEEKEGDDEAKEASQDPWDPAMWNGNVEELRARLMGLTIPHDLKCEIHLILERADASRRGELLAFLVNTASQLSTEQRDKLVDMKMDAHHDEEVRQLLQQYQIPRVMLEQWRRSAEITQQEEASQRSMEDEQEENDSDSSYVLSQGSSSTNTLVVPTTSSRQLRSDAAKRPHSVTPGEAEVIRELMRSKAKLAKSKEQLPIQRSAVTLLSHQDRAETRDAWPEIWDSLKDIWPPSAQVPFPMETSCMEEWTRVAATEPVALLQMAQHFQFPEELLTKLSAAVLEAWTAGWRRECILTGLAQYGERTKDTITRSWLVEWRERIERPPSHALLPLEDSREDWAQLRSRGYGEDETLKLCDIGNKGRLANHFLSALVYEREIRVLTDKEDENDNGGRTRLIRHLYAIDAVPEYKAVFAATPHKVDWYALARYLSTTLEHGSQERDGESGR